LAVLLVALATGGARAARGSGTRLLALLALAAAIVALAHIPGRELPVQTTAVTEPPTHVRALRLEDRERLRRARRALIDAEHAADPIAPVGHAPGE
jgi:hypothetical protein